MNLLDVNGAAGAYPNSLYAANTETLPPFVPPEGDIKTEILVIGAGYTGLSAALHLAEARHEVTLIDAQRVGWGASGRNGGQLHSGQRLEQSVLEKMLGLEKARALWDIAEGAKELVHYLIAEHQIACDYAPGIVIADHRARYVTHTRAYVDHMRSVYGYESISFLNKQQVADRIGTDVYFGGSLDWGAGHLDPLKFTFGLARAAEKAGVAIHEQTRALSIEKGKPVRVLTDHGTITADRLVVAANGYLGLLLPEVASRVMPINSYMAATEPMGEARARALIPDNVAVADSRFVVNYYRLSADHRMLFGGRESYGYKDPTDISSAIRKRMLDIYPQLGDLKIEYDWGGTLGITMNRMPRLARIGDNILNASGFSGHGVALATMGGALTAEVLAGRPKRFDAMANVPSRRFPGGTHLRQPLLVLAMLYYAMRDKF
jgi:gamma-glutamylputrescine oxidase